MIFDQTPGSHMLLKPLLEQTWRLPNVAGRTARTINLIHKVVLEHMGHRGFQGRNFRFGFNQSHYNPTWRIQLPSRVLQQRFKEHMGSRGLIKNHFEICGTSPSEDQVKILGKNRGDKWMSLEALFIHRLKPTLNSKDEYKSRVLKLKFWVESGFNVLGFIFGSLYGIFAPVFRFYRLVVFFLMMYKDVNWQLKYLFAYI